jgi:ferric-dicitrate binding protein FerR (iron transport regulator)/TolA-binding protein
MNCSRIEKYLTMVVGGEADARQEAIARTHMQSCERCRQYFAEAQALHHDLGSIPAFSLIPQGEADAIVARCLDEAALPQTNTEPWWQRILSWVTPPRMVFAAAMVLIAVAGLLVVPRIHRTLWPNHGEIAVAAGVKNGQQIIAISRDTTLFLRTSCAVRLLKGSCCTILRADSTIVKVDLQYGKILLAARKGLYDTIAVYSGDYGTFATGTHFEVDYTGDLTSVAVLEGSVRVKGSAGTETPVRAREECAFGANKDTLIPRSFDRQKRQQMINDFAAMTDANTRYELENGLTEKGAEIGSRDNRNQHLLLARSTPNHTLDSAAAHQYAIAREMIAKAHYKTAQHVLEDYLTKYTTNQDSVWFDLAFCYSALRRYSDAIELYQRIVTESLDEPLIENALHRSNKIMFLKFRDYGDARAGIERYLGRYPHGAWREEAWYYRIKIALSQRDGISADSLLQQFTKEFPRNCKGQELLAEAGALKKQHR